MEKLIASETELENFDRIIKLALKEGFECNYEGDGKWYQEDDGILLTNKQLFKRFATINKHS